MYIRITTQFCHWRRLSSSEVKLPAALGVARARVKLGVKVRDPGVGHHIPHHGEDQGEEEEDERGPLDDGLPGPDLPVVEDKEADSEAGDEIGDPGVEVISRQPVEDGELSA